MSSRKFFGIYNPNARGGRTKKFSQKIGKAFAEYGIDHRIESSNSVEDAYTKLQNAVNEKYDTLFAIGGDGTAHHVANIAIENNLTFAVVPGGSGNDFAANFGLSNDIDNSIETLLHGKEIITNTIKSSSSKGEFWTINVADVGMGAKVSHAAERRLKWMAGKIKYDLIATWEILRHNPVRCRVRLDGKEEELEFHMIIAGLGQTAGSGMNFFPDVRFNHDTMQGGIIQTNCSRPQLLRGLQKVRKAQHKELDYIRMFRAKTIEVESLGEEIMIESEGELRGTTSFKMEVVKDRFKLLVPSSYNFDQTSLLGANQM